ncbi:hypothetical protein TrVFT333_000714 [Trichoderma virens FT-333]|nr:hypothetical protein TrVFT333_000714 [Trichoderma virens FT-333]
MSGLRESAFLPTIKCSSCGMQVEISLMGEHVCPSVELSPPPDSNDKFIEPPPEQPVECLARSTLAQQVRFPDDQFLSDGNKMHMAPGPLTPVSQPGGSRSVSPMTPYRPSFADQAKDFFSFSAAKVDEPAQIPEKPSDANGHRSSKSMAALTSTPASTKPLGFMERMNTITPGPFDTSQRPSTSHGAFPAKKQSITKFGLPVSEEPGRITERPGTSSSSLSSGSSNVPSTPKQPQKNGYEGFGPPSARALDPNGMAPPMRAETFPRPSPGVGETPRRPSYSSPRSGPLASMGAEGERRPSLAPDTSRRPPPRKSLIPSHLPTASLNLAEEFGVSNPYHTSSDSASSGYSTFSNQSQNTAQTSPPRSEARNSIPDALRVRPQAAPEKPRPADLRLDPAAEIPLPARSPVPRSPYLIPEGEEERDDPAIQPGLGQTFKPYRAFSPAMASNPTQAPPAEAEPEAELGPKNESSPRQSSPRQSSPRQPSPRQSSPRQESPKQPSPRQSPPMQSQPAPPVSPPRQSPQDSPRLHQRNLPHYHKLNGSLCGTCGRGIEGQFVEDESRVKHHMDCFCCLDCGRPLSDGYFEVDGKAYCEQDALRRTQPPPPAPFPQGPRRGGYGGPGPRPYGGPPGRMGPGGPGPRPGYGPLAYPEDQARTADHHPAASDPAWGLAWDLV